MPKRFATAGLALCLLFLVGFATRQGAEPRPTDTDSRGATARVDPVLIDLAAETERLRRSIPGVTPAEPSAVRDVFASNSRQPSLPHIPLVEPPPPLPTAPAVSVPSFMLVGIAEDGDDRVGTLQRTAVISGADDALFLVKPGDVIEGRYRVGRVGSDTAEIVDVASGVAVMLALR